MKKVSKILLLVLILAMVTSVMTGCPGTKPITLNLLDKVEFPLKEQVKLTYWAGLGGSVGIINSWNELDMYKALQEKTNVKLEFIHPIGSQVKEQFSVMMASGQYPDMIEGMNYYTGGHVKANEDGIILDIKENGYMDKYAPNLTKILNENPFLRPYWETNEGKILGFSMMRGGTILRQGTGPIFRKDWLLEFNLPIPETLDEWETTLKVFKKNKNAIAPFTTGLGDLKGFMTCFGIVPGYYMENGKVKYGFNEPKYKEFLAYMKKWYNEGLFDKEYQTLQGKDKDARILGHKTGAYVGAMGSGLLRYITVANSKRSDASKAATLSNQDKTFDLQPVPYPVLEKGKSQDLMSLSDPVDGLNGVAVSITKQCKRPDIAIALADYAYSKEGNLIYNFGIEGKDYTMVDGKPKFTDYVMKNPDGKDMSTVGRTTARSFSSGPFIQDTIYGNQFFGSPQQQEAAKIWGKFQKEASDRNFKVRGSLTVSEAQSIATKQSDINTLVDEWFVNFVNGKKPLSEFDNYLKLMKNLGIDQVIETNQKAHDRFINKYPNYMIPYDFDVSAAFWK